jgi:hypothetical protein
MHSSAIASVSSKGEGGEQGKLPPQDTKILPIYIYEQVPATVWCLMYL